MRFARLLVVAAVLAPVGACTEAQEPQVPTAQQTAQATSTPSPAPVQESNYDKALRFTRCMNDTLDAEYPGLGDQAERVPDPVEGKYLQTYVAVPRDAFHGDRVSALMLGKATGRWLILVPEIFEKCKHHLPAVWPVKADPDDQARFGRFYDCLRERGIDVPAPDANGYIHPNPDPEPRGPEYEAAEDACRHLVDDPATKVDS